MTLLVNTNMTALQGQYYVQQISDQVNSSIEKLTTGSRISSARNDAASVQLADLFDTQLTGLTQANRNANYGIAMAQIAEGSLSEINNNLQRAYQLSVMGGNRSLESSDRVALGDEFKTLLETNNLIANNTLFGSINILNYESNEEGFLIKSRPEPGGPQTVTTGNAILTSLFGKALNSDNITGQMLSLVSINLGATGDLGKMVAAYMLINNQSDAGVAADALLTGTRTGAISTLATNSAVQLDIDEMNTLLVNELSAQTGQSAVVTGAAGAFTGFADTDVHSTIGFSDQQLNQIYGFSTDTLLDTLSGLSTEVTNQRSRLGAEQNGLLSTIRSNTNSIVNIKDARSRVADTDFATETVKLTRNQILLQGANTILSQATQTPNIALSLLR
ncbi:flagellin N-terminal helical domain-containing protein [Oceanospirillum sediminis]|uniref:Flagellin n=1 Tax=Oceanospirillum sediminis TaxID=2760088 RepID=A0A839IN72_9GAMM|nr:flagellin [Oceanospirillum sediminis]MBB1485962.1 hypothetical protein [Oceanospirillum sediminis]